MGGRGDANYTQPKFEDRGDSMTPPMKSMFPLLARRSDRALPESYLVKDPETTPIARAM